MVEELTSAQHGHVAAAFRNRFLDVDGNIFAVKCNDTVHMVNFICDKPRSFEPDKSIEPR